MTAVVYLHWRRLLSPPLINDRTFDLGQSVQPVVFSRAQMSSFTVSAGGTPSPSYPMVLNSAAIPGATSSTFSLSAVTTANAGTYSVQVTNNAGTATSSGASLTVSIPSRIVDFSTRTVAGPGADTLIEGFVVSGGSKSLLIRAVDARLHNAFSGAIQIDYTDGAELNGIPEAELTLNIYNGTDWAPYPASTRDATNNFVLTNSISGITLNELTLADLSAPLPLTWLTFTATEQNNSQSLLQWATAQEQNTKDFYIQRSADGINWITIGSVPAAGNSVLTSHYEYVDTNPVIGPNYYRIKQTDIDNRYSYSPVRMLSFTKILQPFTILGNPVTNGVLTVQVNLATTMAFYTADGKLLWHEQVNAGTKTIDVSSCAKGTYLLKTSTTTKRVMIL